MGQNADYDVIVVGGGVAGLTAAAYMAKSGASTLLCEQAATCGGLVHTFTRNGFVYDGGIRAMENSGIVFPMLKDLGLDLPFVKNNVTLGIENRVLRVTSDDVLDDYQALLAELYPESRDEIAEIVAQMRRIMHYMDIQYGIENPIFLDPKEDRDYFIKEILPWVFKYALTIRKVNALKVPVVDYLRRFTQNQSLLDVITQHFFRETPAFFALSYFSLYLDYHYPLGGTGSLPSAFTAFIEGHGGAIKTGTRIVAIDPAARTLEDDQGRTYGYRTLIWAANQKSLYAMVNPATLDDTKVQRAIQTQRELVQDKTGGDSVLTVYLAVDLDPEYFREQASAHVFYTPRREGQSQAGPLPLEQDRAAIEAWLRDFFALTTYEISCPVLRDPALAPPGKTGLIVSVLFDYALTRQIEAMGWYEDFKALCETAMIAALDGSLYPGLKDAVIDHFSSTPLTMARITSNADGAITGWAFTNDPVPAESRLPRVVASVRTPIPGVYQAGQWTFSPAGFPTAILSGKLASDQALKVLKR